MNSHKCAGCGRVIRILIEPYEYDDVLGITFHPKCKRDAIATVVPRSATVNGIERDGRL